MKILVAGFSVLSGSLFKAFDGHTDGTNEFSVSALSAHHFTHLYDCIDHLVDGHGYDVVLLDLVSTPCREWTKRPWFVQVITALVHKLAAKNIKIGFVNFWRFDIDYDNDMLVEEVVALAKQYDLPVIETISYFRQLPEDQQRLLAFDGVHYTPAGAELVRNMIVEGYRDSKFNSVVADPSKILGRHTIAAGDLITAPFTKGYHTRYGIGVDTVEFGENETVTLNLPQGTRGFGVFYVVGPHAGRVRVEGEGWSEEIDLIDVRCYYEHLKFCAFAQAPRQGVIRITQLPGLSDVVLIKGEYDAGPRRCKISLVSVV